MSGTLSVICGPMFAAKTTELIRRVERVERAGLGVQVFVPAMDLRDEGRMITHARLDIESIGISAMPVESFQDFAMQVRPNISVVAIDEGQFLPPLALNEVLKIVSSGRKVIVAGLDLDYHGQPFGLMPTFLAMAEFVTKLTAVCSKCGADASFTHRSAKAHEQILVGAQESYEARCRTCFEAAQ